jgi:hypothetical protein
MEHKSPIAVCPLYEAEQKALDRCLSLPDLTQD